MPENASELAINGGPPAVTCGPFAWPRNEEAVGAALDRAYRDGSWGKYEGSNCQRLRKRLSELHLGHEVQLTCSGTFAVELALRAAGVQSGDGVILAGYDFPGNFRAIEAIGAKPVLCDVVPNGWTIDVDRLAKSASKDKIQALLVSHLHGELVPMRKLRELADARGLKIVEDACQVPGGVVDGRPAGTWGDAGVLSFGGSKLLTAGRGGAVLTANSRHAQRGRIFAGRGNDAFPLSELQAAALLPQLEMLAERNRQRNEAVVALHDRTKAAAGQLKATAGVTGLVPPAALRAGDRTAWYKVAWQLDTVRLRSTRDWIVAALQAEGAPIDVGFRGFAKRSSQRCERLHALPHAMSAAANTILLHHPALLSSSESIRQICGALGKVLSNAVG